MVEGKNIAIGIGIIILVLLAINNSPKFKFPENNFPLFSIIDVIGTDKQPDFQFAGFTWKDTGTLFGYQNSFYITTPCNYGGGQTGLNVGEKLTLTAQGDRAFTIREVYTDVTGIDELLVIYEGYAHGYCSKGLSGGGSATAVIEGSVSGSVSPNPAMGASGGDFGNCFNGASGTKTFQPAIWKFKNNFDGTWSSMQFLGVGDIFIVQGTQNIVGDKTYLKLQVGAGSSCLGSSDSAGGKVSLSIYNIVRKENAFAVCKADKYAYDLNNDGQIATNGSECVDLKTIVLNSEEAIKESYEEKFARVQAELEAKNDGLTADIEALKLKLASESNVELQSRLMLLEQELQATKAVLADVEARDRTVINVIEANEQFEPTPVEAPSKGLPTIAKIVIGILIAFFILRLI